MNFLNGYRVNRRLNLTKQLERAACLRFCSPAQRRRLNNCKNRAQRPVLVALLIVMRVRLVSIVFVLMVFMLVCVRRMSVVMFVAVPVLVFLFPVP